MDATDDVDATAYGLTAAIAKSLREETTKPTLEGVVTGTGREAFTIGVGAACVTMPIAAVEARRIPGSGRDPLTR